MEKLFKGLLNAGKIIGAGSLLIIGTCFCARIIAGSVKATIKAFKENKEE